MNILDKQIVLQLNASWQIIGVRSLKSAIVSLCSESNGQSACFALDMELVTNENGQEELLYANPTSWEDWIKLPVRDYDLVLHSAKQAIRAPTVIVARNYRDLPLRRPRLTNAAIWERDRGVCQYSGKKLSRNQASVDHVLPRARGGDDSWQNLVLAEKKINMAKGDQLNHEIGLTLIRKPFAPKALPAAAFITEPGHPTWRPFLLN